MSNLAGAEKAGIVWPTIPLTGRAPLSVRGLNRPSRAREEAEERELPACAGGAVRRSSLSRRSIIVGSASLLLLPGVRASAQPPRRRPKVAFLLPTAPDDVDTPVDRVRAGLAELGYVDGQTVSLEARFAHHRIERLPALAAELVAAQPDVIPDLQTAPTRALAAGAMRGNG